MGEHAWTLPTPAPSHPTHPPHAPAGTTFCHLFVMQQGMVPQPPSGEYVPRVFGFKIHDPTRRGRREAGQIADKDKAAQ